MILAVLGAILIIAGVAMVVRKTAETWLQRRTGKLDETGEKPKISPSAHCAHRPRSSPGGNRDVRLAIALRLDLRRAVNDIPAEIQLAAQIPEPPPWT
jgi:hypothetical protein